MKNYFKKGIYFSSDCYVADYTNQSDSKVGVMFSESPFEDIPYFHLKKNTSANVKYFAVNFEEYPDFIGDIENCECCFDSISDHGKPWILFLETKYCKPDNIEGYGLKAYGQMYATYHKLAELNVIAPESRSVYFNYSSPGNDDFVPFRAFSFSQDSILKKIEDEKIHMIGFNKLLIATPYHIFVPKAKGG